MELPGTVQHVVGSKCSPRCTVWLVLSLIRIFLQTLPQVVGSQAQLPQCVAVAYSNHTDTCCSVAAKGRGRGGASPAIRKQA